MKFDVLHNFISPVTGRILCDPGNILVGDDAGIAQPSTVLIDTSFVIGFPNDNLPNAQVLNALDDGFVYNTEGILSTSALIPIGNLPDLPFNEIWIGDIFNRPVASGIINELVAGPVESVIPLNLTIWTDSSGRRIRDSGYNVAGLAAIGTAASLAAASAADAAFAAAVASGAAVAAAAAAAAAAIGSSQGATGAPGFSLPGFPGTPGAAGVSGKETVFIDTNLDLSGGRIQDIAPSPEGDYDAVSAKWVWDLLNDNVEIKWE